MKRVVVVAAVPLAFVIAASCSESKDRAPGVPTCMGVTCPSGPGPGTSGSNGDAGPDSPEVSDAPFEVGDAGVSLLTVVKAQTSFTADLASASFDSATVVRAARFGGGTDVESTMPTSAGVHTLTGVAPAFGAPTYLQVFKATTKRTLAAIAFTGEAERVYEIPLYADLLSQNTWNVVAPTTMYPPDSATVVVHVFSASQAKRADGTTALASGSSRPYYDDGVDISPSSVATGSKGTIVFLGITGVGTFPITVTRAMKPYTTVSVRVERNVVTQIALTVD